MARGVLFSDLTPHWTTVLYLHLRLHISCFLVYFTTHSESIFMGHSYCCVLSTWRKFWQRYLCLCTSLSSVCRVTRVKCEEQVQGSPRHLPSQEWLLPLIHQWNTLHLCHLQKTPSGRVQRRFPGPGTPEPKSDSNSWCGLEQVTESLGASVSPPKTGCGIPGPPHQLGGETACSFESGQAL